MRFMAVANQKLQLIFVTIQASTAMLISQIGVAHLFTQCHAINTWQWHRSVTNRRKPHWNYRHYLKSPLQDVVGLTG
jgi:hypothetical protein